MQNASRRSKYYWLAAILVSYFASLAMPAIFSNGFGAPTSSLPGSVIMGYEMLLKLPQVLLAPSWWANPLWGVAVVLYLRDKTRAAIIFSFVALLLASLVLLVGAFPPDRFQWSDLRIGYYVWLASMIELTIAILFAQSERS